MRRELRNLYKQPLKVFAADVRLRKNSSTDALK